MPNDDQILSIKFMPTGERARKIISRSNTRPTGRYPSWRMQRMIHWDSPHELNAYRLLDGTPTTIEFAEQPCIIDYRLNGENHRHYPDTLVRTDVEKSLWEIKTAADARKPEVMERTRLLVAKLPVYGYQYKIALAEELSRQPRLNNTRILLRHGREPLNFLEQECARQLFLNVSHLLWRDVLDRHYDGFTLQHMCRLIMEGKLLIDIDLPIGSNTVVWVKGCSHG